MTNCNGLKQNWELLMLLMMQERNVDTVSAAIVGCAVV